MAKQRLLVSHKNTVISYLKKVVYDKHAAKEKEAARKELSDVVIPYLKKKFPQEEMKTLVRWNRGIKSNLVRFRDQWEYRDVELDESVLTPGNPNGEWVGVYLLEERGVPKEVSEKKDYYLLALNKYDEEKKNIMAKYKSFVSSCKSWEELLEVTPEVDHMRPTNPNNAVSLVPGEVVREIKRNIQERSEEAKNG